MEPVNAVAVSASTSHASTAPEKNVKPRPIRIETSAHAQNGASICQRTDVEQSGYRQCHRAEQVRDPPPGGVGDDPGRHLEENHPGGEEGIGGERLEVREACVQQEDGVDSPDQRRCERVAEQQQEVGPLNRARGRHDSRTLRISIRARLTSVPAESAAALQDWRACPRPSSSARSGATRGRGRSSTCSRRTPTSSAATRAARTRGTRLSSATRRTRSARSRRA